MWRLIGLPSLTLKNTYGPGEEERSRPGREVIAKQAGELKRVALVDFNEEHQNQSGHLVIK